MARFRAEAGWSRWLAVVLVISLAPGCQVSAAQIYIPASYALTGLCLGLLISPTPGGAVVGVILGGVLGAALYNNSLKRSLANIEKPAAPRR